jgi:hypothetical protein
LPIVVSPRQLEATRGPETQDEAGEERDRGGDSDGGDITQLRHFFRT